MIIFLVLIGGAVGAFFGPMGLVVGAILGATLAHSISDDRYEAQHFDNQDNFTLFESGSLGMLGDDFSINPASGLPMLDGGIGGLDVGGNPYGFDLSDDGSVFDSPDFIASGFSDDMNMHDSF